MVTKKSIKIPIFNYKLSIIIFDDWNDLRPYLPPAVFARPGKGVTLCYDDTCIICCSPKDDTTIVHESGHATNAIWRCIGYTPQRDNDEVSCYLQAYIFLEIKKVVHKHMTI